MIRFVQIIPVYFVFSFLLFSQNTEDGYLLKYEGDQILKYQSATNSMEGKYPRTNYIHPLYGLDGEVLTEDFPSDHLHHRGIFWTWSQLWNGDTRLGDGWLIHDVSWEVTSVKEIRDAGKSGLKSECFWYSAHSGSNPFMKDETEIILVEDQKDYRQIDFKIRITALVDRLYIGGSEDNKGYGGFSPRLKLPSKASFEGENGMIIPEITPVSSQGWVNITSKFSDSGSTQGIVLMSHPSNPVREDRWILRSSGSMQNHVFPGNVKYPVPMDEGIELKYSLIIHSGISTRKIKELYHKYEGNP